MAMEIYVSLIPNDKQRAISKGMKKIEKDKNEINFSGFNFLTDLVLNNGIRLNNGDDIDRKLIKNSDFLRYYQEKIRNDVESTQEMVEITSRMQDLILLLTSNPNKYCIYELDY